MGLDRARIVDLGRMDAEPCVLPCKIEPGGTILGGFGPHVGHLGSPGRAGDPIWGGSGPHVGLDRARIVDLGQMGADPCVLPY